MGDCMKTLMLFLFSAVLYFNALSQGKWDYPVKPGSEKWRSFTATSQMIDACRIPAAVLEKMSTQELVEAWENFPLRHDVFASNSGPYDGLVALENFSDALRSLLSRKDVGNVVLSRFKEARAHEKEIYEKRYASRSINDYLLLRLLRSWFKNCKRELANKLKGKQN
jgi:hypothetical protein